MNVSSQTGSVAQLPWLGVDDPGFGDRARYVALWVPNWPLNSLVVQTPPGAPAVTVHGGRVSVATTSATKIGVRVGMTRTLALYHCPELIVLKADRDRESAAFETILEIFDTHASAVSIIRPGLAFAPAQSASRWAGGEEFLARRLVEDVALETGAEIQVGIGSGLGTALAAARKARIIPSEKTAEFLHSLPLYELTRSVPATNVSALEETLQVLAELGVHDGKQLLAIGRHAVASRFGSAGQLLLQMLDGQAPLMPTGERLQGAIEASFELDPPAATLQFATTAMARVSGDLAEKLRGAGLKSSSVKVLLESSSGSSHERTWTMLDAGVPAQVAKRITWQIRGWLNSAGENLEDPDPLKKISLTALSPGNQAEDDPLWGSLRASWKVEQAAEEVQDMLGENAVLKPSLHGGFDPRTRVSLIPWGLVGGVFPELDGPWDGGVSDPPIILYSKPPPALLFGVRLPRATADDWKEDSRLWVDRRGRLNGIPTHVILEQDRTELPSGDYPVEKVVRLWVVRGRWWSGQDLLHGRRCYLRISRLGGSDLLLVQRRGGWEVEGVYSAEESVNSRRDH